MSILNPVPVIPTLGIEGWESNPSAQVAKLWEYYQAADYSQSNSFLGGISSLQYTLQKTRDPRELKNLITTDINNLYGSYFDQVQPMVEVKDMNDGRIVVNVDLAVTRGEDEYTLTRSIVGTTAGIIAYETKLTEKYQYERTF
nr:MAG TPA: hypothetical protein [Caudoviricetes sp.]